jgi:hypothetical protein
MAINLRFRKEVFPNEVCNQGTLFISPIWLATCGSERRFSLTRCATRNIVYFTNMASNLGFRKEVLTNEVHNR